MKFVDMLRRSGRNLRQAKVRTLLTASAIAVGGFTLTLTLAAAAGARQYTSKLIAANFDPSAVSVAKDKKLFDNNASSAPQEYNDDLATIFRGIQVQQLTQSDIAKIKALPHVKNVLENYQTAAQFITRPGAKRYTGSLAVYNPGQKPEVSAGIAPSGDLPDGSVVMPDSYISLLHFKNAQDAIGQQVTVQVRQAIGKTQSYTYTVAAVSTKSSLEISFLDAGLQLSQNDARTIANFVNQGTVDQGKLPSVTVTSDGLAPVALKTELQNAGYAARTAQDAQTFLYQIINVLQIVILVFGFITLVASFFGVVNTQYISVLERTREIGLMKALGMSRSAVSRLFIIEATWIGFIGAVLGSLVALIAGTALNPYISEKLNFSGQHLLIFSPIQVGLLILFLMLVTTVAGLLPARKAAKLDPIEALRTE